jgi:TetR/AcrR family transcriptional repressor of nem operon
MARHKEFNPDEAVEAAVQVFWDKGYEATSIQDLVNAMGINRGSLYDTFGDKAGLFEAALECYFNATPLRRLMQHANSATPRREIERLFDDLIERATSPDGRRGCLLTNTLTELCSRDDRLAKKLGSRMLHIENTLTAMIERGQQSGDIASGREARALARFLISTVQGIQAVAKLGPGKGTLRDIADVALSSLD